MSTFEQDPHEFDADRGCFSQRAQRLLVRVLLALRSEARRSANPARDARRAEELADRILADFPRRILPLGMAAVVAIVIFCAVPLVHDAIPATDLQASNAPVADVVAAGLRNRTAAVSDGIQTMQTVLQPFASDSAPAEPERPAPPCDAAAPFKKS